VRDAPRGKKRLALGFLEGSFIVVLAAIASDDFDVFERRRTVQRKVDDFEMYGAW